MFSRGGNIGGSFAVTLPSSSDSSSSESPSSASSSISPSMSLLSESSSSSSSQSSSSSSDSRSAFGWAFFPCFCCGFFKFLVSGSPSLRFLLELSFCFLFWRTFLISTPFSAARADSNLLLAMLWKCGCVKVRLG